MKKNIIICLLLPLLFAGCQFYESPDEDGVDPTQVTVMANIMVNLTIPQNEIDAVKAATRAEESLDYRHRFIVEAYIDGVSLHREVFYAELSSQSTLTVPVSLNLHARHCQLAVWSDYVKTTEDENSYYNCEILDPVTMNAPSPGNIEYKDAFFATQELDLTPYADEWNVIVPADVELIRPVARYELIATDMTAFRTRMKEAGMENDEFSIRVKYANYRYMGFDLLQQHPKHALMYMSYKKNFKLPKTDVKEYTIAFDYVFATLNLRSDVPVEVDIINNRTEEVVAHSAFSFYCTAGKSTFIRSNFFSRNDEEQNGGIGIDPGFDGEGEIIVDIE